MSRARTPMQRSGVVWVVIALAASLAGQPAHATVTAALKLRPNIGPPTIPFAVKGQGFGASEVVDITFDLALIGTATTSPTGTFSKTVSVPSTATPGNHTVTATGETSGIMASAGFLVRTNWPRFHFDNANTGFNPYENVISTSNVGTLVQRWAVNVGGTAAPDPIVAYGRVYVAPTDGVVRALDPATGALLWSFDTGGAMLGTAPTAANNLIYVGNDNGVVYALSASTGVPVWSRDLGSVARGSPIVTSRDVFIGARSSDDVMSSLDPSTGATRWTSGFAYIGRSPTLAYGEVLTSALASLICEIQALDAATGVEEWVLIFCSEGDANTSTAAAADGLIYDATLGVKGITPDGTVVWSNTPYPCCRYGDASVAEGLVYVSHVGVAGRLSAIDDQTGMTAWQRAITDTTDSSPIVANGVVYLGIGGGLLRAYDAATGVVLWTSPPAAADFDATAAISDGVLYSATADGTVYAFGLP